MKRPVFFFVCLLVLVGRDTADEVSRTQKHAECVNKNLEKLNADFRLMDNDLKRLTKIVDEFLVEEHFETKEEQAQWLEDIKEASKKALPGVEISKLDKIMNEVKSTSAYCARILRS
ncbi:hypothetical protein F1880_008789 [Penicillium rolfsii]|nr:hypothetical protein F1880_008789 [Penicillium rolfsii]